MTNWARRHQDFPKAVNLGGEELFEIRAITAWLDERTIPSNARVAGERAGSTYGERFRRNLAASAGEGSPGPSPGTPESVSSTGSNTTDSLWEDLLRLRGPVDVLRYRNLVLGLVYLRSRNADGWAAARRGAIKGIEQAVPALEDRSPEVHIALRDLRANDRTARQLADIAAIVDRFAGELGEAEAFHVLLGRFATLEGRRGGEFHTPESVVRALVRFSAPDIAREVYDPACGTAELLTAAAIHARGTNDRTSFQVHGTALNAESLALARMNLQLHSADAELRIQPAHALCGATHPHGPFTWIITNPPFNMGGWCPDGPQDHGTWLYGPPPAHRADFAWLQHVAGLLASGGRAAVLMALNTAFSQNPRENVIRSRMVEDGCVEGVIVLPPRLFHSTDVAVGIWLLAPPGTRRNEALLIDASGMGRTVGRTRRELTDADIEAVAGTVDGWRRGEGTGDRLGSAAAVPLETIRRHGYNLNPRKYTGTATGASGGGRTVEALRWELERLDRLAAVVDVRIEREMRNLGCPGR
ncbi:N-6 DNA methylase [Planomonospora parontospora]|uniref:N-6 DNA methylase n=1 Tax=Planomonospora parontospora TaxID=58119 RepID=UPI00177BC943|nr:class I SAM-dependent DNA methyltransferase [Planomonospora parontospora]